MQAWKFYKIHNDISPDYIHVVDRYTKKNWLGKSHDYITYYLAWYVFERTGRVSDFNIISEISHEQFQEYYSLLSKPVWSL